MQILEKYKAAIVDTYQRRNTENYRKQIEDDTKFLDTELDKENYDVMYKHLAALIWLLNTNQFMLVSFSINLKHLKYIMLACRINSNNKHVTRKLRYTYFQGFI